jgi:hypothetical protein
MKTIKTSVGLEFIPECESEEERINALAAQLTAKEDCFPTTCLPLLARDRCTGVVD